MRAFEILVCSRNLSLRYGNSSSRLLITTFKIDDKHLLKDLYMLGPRILFYFEHR